MAPDRERGRVAVLGMTVALAACAGAPPVEKIVAPDLIVAVGAGTITAPDSADSGWLRLRVDEAEDAHIVVVFRLPDNASGSEIASFVTALDTAPATPSPGVAIGGPEVGMHGEVVVHFTPGTYVFACVSRLDDTHRHASGGESRILRVFPSAPGGVARSEPPSASHNINMVDFAYVGPEHWTAGQQLLRVENTGKQDHQLRLARLHDGVPVTTWLTSEDRDTLATTVAGMARMGSGQVAYLPVDLIPGNYVAYCLIADTASRRPHIQMGMLREFKVP